MAGFSGSDVEDLGYDFTKVLPKPIEDIGYTPGKHEIPEPTTVQITAYLGATSSRIRTNANALERWQKRIDEVPADDLESREQVTKEYEVWAESNSAEVIELRRELLSNVCSGDPSVELLRRLPGRWLDAFENYIQDQLMGKASSGTSG